MADKLVCTCGPKGIEFVASQYREYALGARLAPRGPVVEPVTGKAAEKKA